MSGRKIGESGELLELFGRGRALTGEARARWLTELARRDPTTAEELARLLRADERDDSIFERQPPDFGAAPAADPAIERVGPYRLLREIGRGGMGRVYLAEQVGADFVRRVALKRLDRRDASPASERRFRDEVKILAALDHSGIARFLDGGRDTDGAAYLVLEYVEGLDLLEHVRSRGLELGGRLRLFLEVLEAVAYAHAQRVVHRDLKPGNVLVGSDGAPKLLDFGISKLIEPDGLADTATRTELRALTPAYASPEQIRGGALTVASDVYSLGVMLYELVAGVRPFAAHTGSVHELERAVLEEEPEPPSTAARRPTSGSGRKESWSVSSGPRLRLGRDLDAICLKALRKEPLERYGSVAELASDLRLFLEGRPVTARRGGFSYRAAKFVRRHRSRFAAAAIIALLAAVAALAAQRFVAARELRALASSRPRPPLSRIGELSARFAESPDRPEIGLELIELLLAAGRGSDAMDTVTRLRQLPDPLGKGVRVDLVEARAALAVSQYQRAAGAAKAALSAAEAAADEGLARRARLLHGRALLRLSQPEEAERRLAELFDEARRAGDPVVAAESLIVRAAAAVRGERTAEARKFVELALPQVRALGEVALESEALVLRARLEGEAGQVEEALVTIAEALAIAVSAGDLAGEASALVMRAVIENWHGDDVAAFASLELSVQRLRVSGNREQLLMTLGNLALTRIERGEFDRAQEALAEAEPIARELASPLQRGYIFRARGYLEEQRGNTEAGRAAYEAAIAAAREAGANRPLARYLAEIAWLEQEDEKPAAAEAAAREALAIFESVDDRRSAIELGPVLAWAEAAQGDVAGARRRLETLWREAERSDSESAKFHLYLGEALVAEAAGDYEEAVKRRRASVEKAQAFSLPSIVLVQRYRLAVALDLAGRRDEAVALAAEVVAEAERIGMHGIAQDAGKILVARVPKPIRG